MTKLFKVGRWKGYGTYYIVMAETKQEALEMVNQDIKKQNERYGYDFLEPYKMKDVAVHDTNVWRGEWA